MEADDPTPDGWRCKLRHVSGDGTVEHSNGDTGNNTPCALVRAAHLFQSTYAFGKYTNYEHADGDGSGLDGSTCQCNYADGH